MLVASNSGVWERALDHDNENDDLKKVIEAGKRKPGPGPKGGQKGKPKGPRSDYLQIEPDTPGYKLVQIIFERAVSEGISTTELAESLGAEYVECSAKESIDIQQAAAMGSL